MIRRKSLREIERMRASGQIVYQARRALEERIAPGVTLRELDALAEEIIRSHGARPAFKGYRGFPATICASVNAQVVHGIPDATALREGDLVSIDLGACRDGYYGDAAFTVGVGKIAPEARRLIETTWNCLRLAIEQARVGNHLSDISHAVQTCAERNGFSVVRRFGGHGIGRALHEDPHIDNYGPPGRGPHLRAGFVLALEPILSAGGADLVIGEDGWTTTTRDGGLAAHCEHTVAITRDGPDILTFPPFLPVESACSPDLPT